MTLLSIIIPCYNEAEGLPALLRRIEGVCRERRDIEFVLVDNGSTDDTGKLLRAAAEANESITPVRVEANQGYGYGILRGLEKARGEFLGWTHADMQTDPADVLRALRILEREGWPPRLYLKGRRCGRPAGDMVFAIGMGLLESLLFRRRLWDINAQPNIFHRSFYEGWNNPPHDFSLDLYAYATAARSGLRMARFPVLFADREYGSSNWNVSLGEKLKVIRRTLGYSLRLIREGKACKS